MAAEFRFEQFDLLFSYYIAISILSLMRGIGSRMPLESLRIYSNVGLKSKSLVYIPGLGSLEQPSK